MILLAHTTLCVCESDGTTPCFNSSKSKWKNFFLQWVISKELDITFCIIRAQRLREINQQNLSQQKNNGGDLNKYAVPKGKKGNHMTKTTKGYAISHNDKTITLTKAYAKKANTPGTREFKELANLHKNFPDYDIVMRTANITAEKNTHDGLTIERIEKIISAQTNAEELMKEYKDFISFWGKEVEDKKTGKKVMRAPYGKVKSWYLKKVKDEQVDESLIPAA